MSKILIYIVIMVGVYLFRAYKKARQNEAEQKVGKPADYGQYKPKPQPQGQQAKKPKSTSGQPSLDDILKEIMEAKQQPQQTASQPEPMSRPAEMYEPKPTRQVPLDAPVTTEAKKSYRFDDSLVPTMKQELEKANKLKIKRKPKRKLLFKEGLTPRKAFLYKELLDKKYF